MNSMCSMAQFSAVGNKIIINFGIRLTSCLPKQVQSIAWSLEVLISAAKCLSIFGFCY